MNKTFLVPAIVALSSTGSTAATDLFFNSNYEHILGTSLALKLGASSRVAADRAQLAVLSEIERHSRILSSWDSNSEFSRWVQSYEQPVRVSRELFECWVCSTSGASARTAR
jgi:thiamine biosynthesis lipoprotein ApbE